MSEYTRFNAPRNFTRAMQTLLGICMGLIADNALTDNEIEYLSIWLADNGDLINEFPADIIHQRISQIMADGHIGDDERVDLLQTLKELSGTEFMETGSAEAAPMVFPCDQNALVVFVGKSFCFTGRFVTGTRKTCEGLTRQLGGEVHVNVTKTTDYLVIGTTSSPDWLHANHGLKIRKAVELRKTGTTPIIVTEQAWLNALDA